MPRGFILQPTYRIERGRPVVQLYGTLEGGASFLVRDRRQTPYVYVLEADAGRIAQLGLEPRQQQPPRTTMRGERVRRIELTQPAEAAAVRERLSAAGLSTFEADVRFPYRYLIDHGIRGSLEIRGAARPGEGVAHVFDDPEVLPADWTPSLTVLSLDIETDPRARRLLSVGLSGCGADEVLLLTPPGYSCPAGAVAFADERSLLLGLVRRVRELDPDVITGWNVIDFDFAVLSRLARQRGVSLALGRGPEPLRVSAAPFPRGASRAFVPGRLILDGMQLLRGAFVKVERYGLDAVAREILGEGKTMTGGDRAGQILRAFEEDREHFVKYNLQDARLVLRILDRLHLLELTVQRSRLTGMPPDRVGASIASFDHLYLSQLTRRRIVAPSVAGGAEGGEPSSGGHVLEPQPGLYRNVLVFDFRSLYPSLIRTFQIDPLGHAACADDEPDPIVAPNGATFRREPGILPGMLDELFPRREAARAEGDRVASQAIKILMNSFYGVLGASGCRFADPALANAITGFGREILLWTKRRIEAAGHRVLYGDTDSLFVLSGTDDASDSRDLGAALSSTLTRDLGEHIRRTWGVVSRLELEFERLYLRLFLPQVRGGTVGARKRYAGLVAGERDEPPRVVFTGMEVVRRDWTKLAKRVQRELYARLFADRPVDRYLREVVTELRSGSVDGELVYRKGLRKDLGDYTASTPPHVVAARRMTGRPGRVISYVITVDGAQPAAESTAALDHEHYLQKQVRPVAEPVLGLLGLDFDRLIGDDTQLRLF